MAKENRQGLTIVFTGNGKGKTTAALGTIFRAWGRGFRICVFQFLKAETGHWGEVQAAKKLGIEWYKTGDGFTWTTKNMDESKAKALHGWESAKQKISSGEYDLILLDEFTYPLVFGWIDTQDTIKWLLNNKPANLHLIITGRDAPQALIDYADLVTKMEEVKHPFNHGIKAQPGIEF